MRQDFDVIVVGGGAMGTAAARSLAERGRNTLLVERFEIGHARGSSGGATRIFRLSYHHPDYVQMARARPSTTCPSRPWPNAGPLCGSNQAARSSSRRTRACAWPSGP